MLECVKMEICTQKKRGSNVPPLFFSFIVDTQ